MKNNIDEKWNKWEEISQIMQNLEDQIQKLRVAKWQLENEIFDAEDLAMVKIGNRIF